MESSHSTDRFQAILYSNFCLTCLSSAYGFHLIWYKTPKQMHVYRWFLLDIQFCAFCVDLSVSMLFQPLFIVSHRAFCIVGVVKYISSSIWVANFALSAMILLMGLCAVSIASALVYRLASVFNLQGKMTSPEAVVLIVFSHVFLATLVAIPFVVFESVALPMQPQIWNGTYQAFPEMRVMLSENICLISPQELIQFFTILMLSDFALVTLCLCICVGMIAASFVKLFRNKALMTAKTYQMHLQFNLAMVAQFALPFFTMYMPITAADICNVFQMNCPSYIDSIAVLMSLHSSLNVLMMVCFTGHYRRATAKLICGAAHKIGRLVGLKEGQQSVTKVTVLATKY